MNIKVIVVAKSGCTRCLYQKVILENICEVEKYYWDTKKDKEICFEKFGVDPLDEDSVPVYILYIDGVEVYRNFSLISPQRIEIEKDKMRGKK